MKRNKFFICVNILILLITFLILLGIDTQAKEEAKDKLQQAVNDSFLGNDLDIQKLKNKIENDMDNSKVINKDTSKFPLHTVVDGYDFKIEEDGKVEDVGIEDTSKNEETENNQTNSTQEKENKTNEEEKNEEEKIVIVKYADDEKTDKGITITTTKDGVVSINGKSTDKLFIKISNNIQISNNSNSFEEWKQEEGILIEKGKQIKQKVIILNNTVTKGQVNVVLRTEKNEALGVLKLTENQTEYIAVLNENIIANYIYIDKDVEIENIRFKVEITEEEEEIIETNISNNTA